MERHPAQNENRDRQLERLAGQIRDTGVAPDRDLWPEINSAIDRQEHRSGNRNRLAGSGSWPRLIASAAVMAVMLAAGWAGIRSVTENPVPPGAGPRAGLPGGTSTPAGPGGGLEVIDQALDELTLALAEDPENRNLSHLVLVIHKTRGNLLRRNSENLVRN